MCGIVGYIGNKDSAQLLLEGLKRLEYRGYDSSGLAILEKSQINLIRSVGKISQLEELLKEKNLPGNLGIGHTRWATHGKPSEENAHPHTDCSQRIVVVHNGIIENYPKLKQFLIEKGHRFKSQTDTEIIPHLLEEFSKGGGDRRSDNFLDAFSKTLSILEGSYAVGIINADIPDKIFAARKDSPLIIGVSENENFLASDIPAVLPFTKNIIVLEDEDFAVISDTNIEIFNLKKGPVSRKIQTVMWNLVQAEKSGFKHFMLKEIFEQPRVIQDTLRGRINYDDWKVDFSELEVDFKKIATEIDRIIITACGTSYHAALVGKFIIEEIANIPVEVYIASEYHYQKIFLDKKTLFVTVSQSGETADTKAALKASKAIEPQLTSLAICNVVGSSITRDSTATIYTHCGPEIGVASTKAFTGQLIAIYLLAIALAQERRINSTTSQMLIKNLTHLPLLIQDLLDDKTTEVLAKKFFKKHNFLYLGRNINYPIALEGALKLKEISYIHAEGYPAGEMKHGPIALIDENMPVVVIATKSKTYEKIIGNIEEVKARNGIIIAVANYGNQEIKQKADEIIWISEVDELFSPVVNIIPLQLLAYHIANLRGCDVDQPRNLAKSVTVL